MTACRFCRRQLPIVPGLEYAVVAHVDELDRPCSEGLDGMVTISSRDLRRWALYSDMVWEDEELWLDL